MVGFAHMCGAINENLWHTCSLLMIPCRMTQTHTQTKKKKERKISTSSMLGWAHTSVDTRGFSTNDQCDPLLSLMVMTKADKGGLSIW